MEKEEWHAFLKIGCLEFECLGLLPGEDIAAKMAVRAGLLEDWVLQLQVSEVGKEN